MVACAITPPGPESFDTPSKPPHSISPRLLQRQTTDLRQAAPLTRLRPSPAAAGLHGGLLAGLRSANKINKRLQRRRPGSPDCPVAGVVVEPSQTPAQPPR